MKRTLNTSRGSVGYWFILPWIIGFVLFFLQPIVQLVYMSFSSFKLSELGLSLEPLDDIWKHYKYALTGDSYFPVYLIGSITELLFVPVMVFFSLFSGVLLSQTFRGRTVMRAGGGLKVGLYYSLIDWHNPHYPHYGDLIHPMNDNPAYKDVKHNFQQYVEYMHNQVRELCTNYGTIDMLWFDFSYGDMSGEKREATRLIDMVREYQPDIVIDNRLDNPSNSILSDNPTYFCGDFASPEQLIPPESVRNSKGEEVPWESCITMNNHWGYHRHDRDYKSPKLLIRSLVECVSKGGNLLINVGPDGRGCFPDECLRLLEHVGRWMEKNGDSIYSCGAAKQPKPDIGRLTAKGNKLYFHIFDPVIGPIPLKMNDREKIKRIRFIASGSELSITKDFTAGLYPEYIYMYFGPDPNATYDFPDEIDTVVEIEMKR